MQESSFNVKNNFGHNSHFFSFFIYILEQDSLLLPIGFVQYFGGGGGNDDCLSYYFSRNEEVFWPSLTEVPCPIWFAIVPVISHLFLAITVQFSIMSPSDNAEV